MFVLIMCVLREYSVLTLVPKVGFTHILLAVDLMFVVGGMVGWLSSIFL